MPLRKSILFTGLMILLNGLLCTITTAQSLVFRNFTREQGLPSDQVYKLIQDRKGYVWGISDAGLFRYDGTTFKTFGAAEGLKDFSFYCLMEDYRGRIWASSSGGTTSYFENGSFNTIAASAEIKKYIGSYGNLIHDLYVDKGDTLWLATTLRGLKVLSKNNSSRFEIFPDPKIHYTYLLRLLSDSTPFVTNASELGGNLTMFIKGKKEYATKILIRLPDTSFVTTISWDIIYGTRCQISCTRSEEGEIFFSHGNVLYRIGRDRTISPYVFPNKILETIITKDKRLWICFDKGGLYSYPNTDPGSKPLKMLSNTSVTGICIDNENNLWVSTLNNGIYFSAGMRIYGFPDDQRLNQKIMGLANWYRNPICINSSSEVLRITNPGYEISSIGNSDKVNIADPVIMRPVKDGLWILGKKSTLLRPDGSSGLPSNRSAHRIYISDVIAQGEDNFIFLTPTEIGQGTSEVYNQIQRLYVGPRCFIQAGADSFLIGTVEGLYVFSKGRLSALKETPASLNVRINFMMHDSNGRLWVCTRGHGLFFRTANKWYQISSENGLPGNICNTMTESTKDNFFCGTTEGLALISFRNDTLYTIRQIGVKEGLPGKDISALTYTYPNIWVGTSRGLFFFKADEDLSNSIAPRIELEAITLENGDALPHNSRIELAYNQNSITIHTHVLAFRDPSGTRIRYQLSGNDLLMKRDVQGNRFELQNLPPDKYELKIWGLNESGLQSEEPVLLYFEIFRPLWKRTWFITLIAVAIVSASYLFFRWRLKVQSEKNTMLRRLDQYRLDALRAQMNPHFVFNAINGIQRRILEQDPHKAYNYLAQFSQLIRHFLTATSEQWIPLEKEAEALKLYADIEKLRFDNSFEFELHIDPELEKEDTLIPSMLIQPFVENAIWHGIMPLEGKWKGRVMVEINKKGLQLQIFIKDNGVGLQHSHNSIRSVGHVSMGIDLARKRIHLLTGGKGEIKVNSVPPGEKSEWITQVEIVI